VANSPLAPSDEPGQSRVASNATPITPYVLTRSAWDLRKGAGEFAMAVIAMLNQKGGVGKTSVCHHLAGTLAQQKKRTLIVDNDPQASLTRGFWGLDATTALSASNTIAAILANQEPYPELVIRPTGVLNLDLLPGSKRATSSNKPDPHLLDIESQRSLKLFLDEVKGNYEYVIIDCPPNLHLCSWAALIASDYVICPLKPEDYGAQGIPDVNESVELVISSGANPHIKHLGYLLTLVATRKAIHKLFEEELRKQYGDAVFTTRITEVVDYVEALLVRLPAAQYKPKGSGAKMMTALAAEIEARINSSFSATLAHSDLVLPEEAA
jgi:chromosome partitioning protein